MKPSEIFFPWRQIRTDLVRMVDHFDEDELNFQPFHNSWSVKKIFLHVAECEDYWMHSLVTKSLPTDIEYDPKDYSNRQAVKNQLMLSHTRSQQFIDSLTEADLDSRYSLPENNDLPTLHEIIWHIIEHEIHHRGELSLSLGLLGRDGLDV